MHRTFRVAAPNRLWVAEINYVPTRRGFFHLLSSSMRPAAAWSVGLWPTHLRTELVLDTPEMALWQRQPAAGLIWHSDRGFQSTSLAFGNRCRRTGIAVSMRSVGDCNALARASSPLSPTHYIGESAP